MLLSKDMTNIADDIVSSYAARIESISSIFDATCQLIESFQDSFLDVKQERQQINIQVREILARNEHLRKRDFDNMMQCILSIQDEREKEVRDFLNVYLHEQRDKATALMKNLAKFRNSLADGEARRVKEFQAFIRDIFVNQEQRKEEVISGLKEFQREQHETAKRLRELLDKGRDLRIKDLKSMLKEFKILHDERAARREERKREVRTMFGDSRRKQGKPAPGKPCRGD
jgi:hypothetical protein